MFPVRFGRLVFLGIFLMSLAASAEGEWLPKELKDPFYEMGGFKNMLVGAELTQGQLAAMLGYRQHTTWERERQLEMEVDVVWHEYNETYRRAGPADKARLEGLATRVEHLHAERERLKREVANHLRTLLSPEQLAHASETAERLRDLNAERQALRPTIQAGALE